MVLVTLLAPMHMKSYDLQTNVSLPKNHAIGAKKKEKEKKEQTEKEEVVGLAVDV